MRKGMMSLPGISDAVGDIRIPGQAPKLLLDRRRLRVVNDMSGITQLTKPPESLNEPVYPSSTHTFRDPAEVMQGLPLAADTARDFELKLRELVNEGSVVQFRKGLIETLRQLAPQDVSLRNEIGRRAVSYYRETASQRPNRQEGPRLVIQKSWDRNLERLRSKLMLRPSSCSMMSTWGTEEASDELHKEPTKPPPGWTRERKVGEGLLREPVSLYLKHREQSHAG